MSDPREQFRDAISRAGLTPPDSVDASGDLHRFASNGKRNDDSGWYVFHDDGIAAGSFGCWRAGLSETWKADIGRKLSHVEQTALHERAQEAQRKRAADEVQRHAEAARAAAKRWNMATPAREDHPYLARKGVHAHGIRQDGDDLVIPMRDATGALHSLQTIPPDGKEKRYLPGGRVKGCYYGIGKPNGVLCIAEGFATGASIHEATGHAVAVAFSAGNLEPVAAALRAKLPDVRIVMCADDDYRTDSNPGIAKATAAAYGVGGLVAIPDFGDNRPNGATDFNDLARSGTPDAVKRAIANAVAPDVSTRQDNAPNATAGDSSGNDWREPQALGVAEDLRPYPLDALPGGIREAVSEVLAFVQCPPALAACSALSALSLAAQGLANVRRAAQLDGPIGLYLLAVADSGERKTTCDGHFLQPIRQWEAEQAELAKPDIARHAAEMAAWGERKAGIQSSIRDLAKQGKDCDGKTRELESVEAECPQPLRVPRLIHSDATPEALAWTLANGWPSGGVMSSEAGIVFGGHGMGRDSVMRNLSLLNALWDGATHRVERRSSDSFTLTGARLTMGLAAQPETVRQFMEGTKGLARGNGFAARFLIACPPTTQGTRRFREAAAWRHVPAFHARLRALLDTPVEVDDTGALAPAMLEMADEARAVWIRFHDDVEGELRPGGDMSEARDVASKAADNVARMATLFHLFAHGPSGKVGTQSVESAAQIVGWHLYQARAFLGDVAAPREVSNARRLDSWLLDYCQREGLREVERRTIQNRGPNPVRGKVGLDAALLELVEAGRIREADDGKRKIVRINPALLGGENGAP